MKRKQALDRLDWRILDALQADARMTHTAIGKRIGLSPPAVAERIRRLEEHGVIDGYAARLNPKQLGLEIGAFIRLQTTHAQIRACLKAFAALPEIVEAHRITGEDCFIVRIVVDRMSRLEAAVDGLAQFGSVTTSIVLASYPPKPIAAPRG